MRALLSLLLSMGIASAAQMAAATPFAPGNILVIRRDGSVSTTWALAEYTSTGTLVQKFAVPYPTGPYPATERPRGLALAPDGRVAIFNGTFDPYLSIFDPSNGVWTHSTHPEWSVANVLSYGDVAVLGGKFFVPDAATFQEEAAGLIRFDPASGSSIRFGDAHEYRDVSASFDGSLLYAMRGTGDSGAIDLYDPWTLDLLQTIRLEYPGGGEDYSGLAVDSHGDIFAARGRFVDHYGHDGTILSISERLGDSLTDIDVSIDGAVVGGSRNGDVFVSDLSLENFARFSSGSSENVFVQVVPEPGTGTLVIAGLLGLAGWRRVRDWGPQPRFKREARGRHPSRKQAVRDDQTENAITSQGRDC